MSQFEQFPHMREESNIGEEQQKGLPPVIHDVVRGNHVMPSEIKQKELERPASVERVMSGLSEWAKGELNMNDTEAAEYLEKTFVPDNAAGIVTAPDNLDLSGTSISYFPPGVHALQCADFSHTNLVAIPEIDVDLTLFLNNTKITSISGNEKFRVGKNLIVPQELQKEAQAKLRDKVAGVIAW